MEILNQIEFTSDTWCVVFPIFLCMIDVATGYVNAWCKKEVSSKIMREGLGKKFGEIAILILGWLTYQALGIHVATTFAALFVTIMEATSISENLEKLGVPLPNFIRKRINNIKDDMEGKDDIQ